MLRSGPRPAGQRLPGVHERVGEAETRFVIADGARAKQLLARSLDLELVEVDETSVPGEEALLALGVDLAAGPSP